MKKTSLFASLLLTVFFLVLSFSISSVKHAHAAGPYTLTVGGSGACLVRLIVGSSPNYQIFSDGNQYTQSFPAGTVVTAYADAGYVHAGNDTFCSGGTAPAWTSWSGTACTNNLPYCTFTMNSDLSLISNTSSSQTDLMPKYTIHVAANPTAGGTIRGFYGQYDFNGADTGLQCGYYGTVCDVTGAPSGSIVNLQAWEMDPYSTSDQSNTYLFDSWSGCPTNNVSSFFGVYPINTCSVPVMTAQNVTANYVQIYPINFRTMLESGSDPAEPGTISYSPASTFNYFFKKNTVVTLTQTPKPGYTFSRWAGSCTGTSNTCTVTMDGIKDVKALYYDPAVTFTVNKTNVIPGDRVTLTWTTKSITSCITNYKNTVSYTTDPDWLAYSPSASGGQWTSNPLTKSQSYNILCTSPDGSGHLEKSLVVLASTTFAVSLNPATAGGLQSFSAQNGSPSLLNCGYSYTSPTTLLSPQVCSITYTLDPIWGVPPTVGQTAGPDYTFTGWSGDVGGGTAANPSNCGINYDCGPAYVSGNIVANFTLKKPTITLTSSDTYIGSGERLFFQIAHATTCTGSSIAPGNIVGGFPTNTTTGNWATGGSGYVDTAALNTLGIYTYSLTCTNTSGSTSATTTFYVLPLPVGYVSLTASPASVNVNGTSSLTWTPSNVTSCTSFSLPASTWTGSKAIAGGTYPTPNLSTTTTYVINCTGYYGAASATTTVTVKQAPIITLTANPPSVALNSSSTLTWSVLNNVTSCTASGGWSGTKAITGGSVKTANLATTTSYTLSCTGSGGTSATTTTVTINQPAPTVTLTAASSSIAYNGSTTLTWSTTYATSCVATGGSSYWNGSSLATTTTHWSTGISTTTYNYIINCTGPGGSASASTTVTVGVAPAPTLILTANPSSVAYGSTSIISWSSANTDSCLAGGTDLTYWFGSSTAPTGSWTTENLTESQTYSLTCTNEATHNSISTSTTVTVGSAPTLIPTVSLTSENLFVASGTAPTLDWAVSNVDLCYSASFDGVSTTTGVLFPEAYVPAQPTDSGVVHDALAPIVTSQPVKYTLRCVSGGVEISTSTTVGVTNISPIPVNISVDFNSIGVGGSCIVSGGGTFASGTPVTVTATPASGSLFNYWSDNGTQVSYSQSYSFIATADRTLTANCSAKLVAPANTVLLYIGSSVSDAVSGKWAKLRGPGGLSFALVWSIPSIYRQDECVPTQTYPTGVPSNQWSLWSTATIASSTSSGGGGGGSLSGLSTAFTTLPAGTYRFKLSCTHTNIVNGNVTKSTASTTLQLTSSYSSEG